MKNKLAKRQGRHEEAMAADIEQLQDELSKTRLDLEASQARFREVVQARDAQLAAAETQALSMRGHMDVLEADVKRLTEQMAAREKELVATYDERLHLELKQQQLRYERRLQVRVPAAMCAHSRPPPGRMNSEIPPSSRQNEQRSICTRAGPYVHRVLLSLRAARPTGARI